MDKAKLDLSYVVKNSGTVSLTKVKEEIGSSIIGKVNVSTESGNIINSNGEPLYASVDLLYDPKDNVLTLTRSGNVDKQIKLNEFIVGYTYPAKKVEVRQSGDIELHVVENHGFAFQASKEYKYKDLSY